MLVQDFIRTYKPRTGVVRVMGEINGATVDDVRSMLAITGPVAELHVFIDSQGGDCGAMLRIMEAIRRHPAEKVVSHGVGRIFSSAGPIFLMGHERLIASDAAINLHDADTGGDIYDPQAMEYTRIVVDAFASRMPTVDRAVIAEWCHRGVTFDVADAIRLGLATGIDTSKARSKVNTRGANRPEPVTDFYATRNFEQNLAERQKVVSSSAEAGCDSK